MRNISELFEFISHCDKETLINELDTHCDRLLKNAGPKFTRQFKIDVENLNTLFRLSEWYLEKEIPRMIEEKNPKIFVDEIMTVEGAALYMKVTTAHVYNLVKKGKLKGCDVSAADKPGARESIRIRQSEIDRFLGEK